MQQPELTLTIRLLMAYIRKMNWSGCHAEECSSVWARRHSTIAISVSNRQWRVCLRRNDDRATVGEIILNGLDADALEPVQYLHQDLQLVRQSFSVSFPSQDIRKFITLQEILSFTVL